MMRKVLLYVIMICIVLGLSGCANEKDLKEEDMVSMKRDCYVETVPFVSL